MQDTFINERYPDDNRCAVWVLYNGWEDEYDKAKQPLIQFDIEPTVGAECTRIAKYWKRHTQYGPAPRDLSWDLILPSGENSDFFLSEKSYYEVLQTSPWGNAYYFLARQYIAAELNVLSGASIPAGVQDAFNTASALLNTYTPDEVGSWNFRHPKRRQFRSKAFKLLKYNRGIIGPGRCGS